MKESTAQSGQIRVCVNKTSPMSAGQKDRGDEDIRLSPIQSCSPRKSARGSVTGDGDQDGAWGGESAGLVEESHSNSILGHVDDGYYDGFDPDYIVVSYDHDGAYSVDRDSHGGGRDGLDAHPRHNMTNDQTNTYSSSEYQRDIHSLSEHHYRPKSAPAAEPHVDYIVSTRTNGRAAHRASNTRMIFTFHGGNAPTVDTGPARPSTSSRLVHGIDRSNPTGSFWASANKMTTRSPASQRGRMRPTSPVSRKSSLAGTPLSSHRIAHDSAPNRLASSHVGNVSLYFDPDNYPNPHYEHSGHTSHARFHDTVDGTECTYTSPQKARANAISPFHATSAQKVHGHGYADRQTRSPCRHIGSDCVDALGPSPSRRSTATCYTDAHRSRSNSTLSKTMPGALPLRNSLALGNYWGEHAMACLELDVTEHVSIATSNPHVDARVRENEIRKLLDKSYVHDAQVCLFVSLWP
jgi:hypothetical protein